jgi:hypothetical protein
MKTPFRLEQALQKLYVAFHKNELHPECCKQCAVGNILDNREDWKHLTDYHGSVELNYVGKVHEVIGRKFNGYSPLELLKIEVTFLKACGYKLPLHYKNSNPKNPTDKDVLFNGLSAVVAFLCELDNIQNVMDYSKLFEYENNKPKYKLKEILL